MERPILVHNFSRNQFSVPPKNCRPMSAFPNSWNVIKTDLQQDHNNVLYELMFKHGRQLEQVGHETSKLGNAWRCENKAFRQMHCTSARTPRRRLFNTPSTIEQSADPSSSRQLAHRERIKRARSAPPMRFYHTVSSESVQAIRY
ncbi:uncharacterized protein LOC135469093 isoform X2 [Liolophura sinensis]|uniref:uncharacterized protein LOC135469093 isoform X2 n=1 Tax=Liolophura sinensis TaxID=3198878 RepID=UPI003158FC0A